MKVILQVNGREMAFSKEELAAIVEKYFSNTTKHESEVLPPREGEWFEVNIQTINNELFKDERADRYQEKTRQLILDAFEEVKKAPKKYSQFKTMMPKKEWESKTVGELKEYATRIGDNMADWVEQAMEWAQRITNGESWETVCNESDTSNLYRLISWKNGYARIVGGSCSCHDDASASCVGIYKDKTDGRLNDTVPLVVLYEK